LSDAALADANYVPVGQLPADWLKLINETLAAYRKMWRDNPPQQQLQQTGPP
jgi:hypothetical protein